MRRRLPVVVLGVLLVLALIAGCTIPQVIDFFYPWGGPNEPGISREERRIRLERENIQQATGQPFTSDRQ